MLMVKTNVCHVCSYVYCHMYALMVKTYETHVCSYVCCHISENIGRLGLFIVEDIL